MSGNFFAIGKAEWAAACKLGLNPAVAFLVLARGTGPDNVTTKWSAESIQEHTGISWRRAKEAIVELEKAALAQNVTELGARKRPTRKLALPDELELMLWLPNSLVDGAGGATPPVARLRQTQNVEWLQAYIELYGEQDLAGDGGLPRKLVREPFSRTHIGDAGQFRLYGFSTVGQPSCNTLGPLLRFQVKEQPKEGWPAWQFLEALKRLRLLEVVHYLAEGERHESELLHALSGDSKTDLLNTTITRTIDSLPEWFSHEVDRKAYDFVLPVLRDFPAPSVVGVYRLTHRPQTKLTAAWYAKHMEACEQFTRVYEAIASGDFKAAIAA